MENPNATYEMTWTDIDAECKEFLQKTLGIVAFVDEVKEDLDPGLVNGYEPDYLHEFFRTKELSPSRGIAIYQEGSEHHIRLSSGKRRIADVFVDKFRIIEALNFPEVTKAADDLCSEPPVLASIGTILPDVAGRERLDMHSVLTDYHNLFMVRDIGYGEHIITENSLQVIAELDRAQEFADSAITGIKRTLETIR